MGVEPLPGVALGCWGVRATPLWPWRGEGAGGSWAVGTARRGQINKEGPGGGQAGKEARDESADWRAGRWPLPCPVSTF